MPPPTTSTTDKLIEYLDKTGHSLEDFFSKIYRDIPEPDTKEAQLRTAARLPLRAAQTDPTLLEAEREDAKKKQEYQDELRGIDRTRTGNEFDRYLGRIGLRGHRTPKTEAREKQKELRESGEVTVPSHPSSSFDKFLGYGQSATRLVSDIGSGDIVLEPALKAAGLDEDSTKKATRAGRGGAGTATGLAWGMKAQKFLPTLALKAAAPLVGALGGRIFADFVSSDYEIDEKTGLPLASEPTTKREGIEAVATGLGSQSVLTTLKSASSPLRMVVGGAEVSAVNELALQALNYTEKGEPLPMELNRLWDDHKLDLLLGGLVGKFAGGKARPTKMMTKGEVDTQVGKINKELKENIELLRKRNSQKLLDAAEKQGVHITSRNTFGSDLRKYADELEISLAEKIKKLKQKADKDVGNAWRKSDPKFLFEESRSKALGALRNKVTDAKFLSIHASTKGKRNAAKRLADQLKKDIKDIENNPIMLVDNSNPRQMQRLLTIMRNNKAVGDKSAPIELREDEILFLNSIETGQAEDMAKTLVDLGRDVSPAAIARQVASYRKSVRGPFKSSELVTKGQDIERLGDGWLGTNIKKYTTDPLFKWANRQKSDSLVGGTLSKVQALGINKLSLPMINRLYMGTADILERAAQSTGVGEKSALFQLSKGLRKSVDDGNFLSADYRFRFLNKADELGYGTYTNRPETRVANKEFEDFMKLRHSKAGGVRSNADDYLDADNLRIARSKAYYDKMSPMGKALVDGWSEASGRAGSKMISLDVLVKMPDGTVRKAQKHINYWPRKLKPEFEELIEDNFKLYESKGEDSTRVKEMLKVFGARNRAQLEQKLGGYIKMRKAAVMTDGSPTSFYSHLERARMLEELPPDAQDFSVDLAANYLHRSGTDLAKIENFGGQGFKVGANGQTVDNENFIFNIINKGDSNEQTKRYVDEIHNVIFAHQSDPFLAGANKWTTGLFIANPSSAIKNLTGAFKTWTITGNEPMTRATIKALWNTVSDAGSKLKGINRRTPDSALAKRIGATSDDIGRLATFVDNTSMTKGARSGGQGGVGAALKYTGFTPAEDFVRKQGTIAGDLARREFMDVFDGSPNARELVDAINQLHANPKSAALRSRVKTLISVDPKVNKKLAQSARFTAKQNIDLAKMADERFAKVMGKDTPVRFDPEASPETRRFLQSWTKETQGGYKIDQLPLFMQNDAWRTFFKFQSWGQQMQRHFHKNIFGEAKEGNVKPLLKWLAAAQLSGEVIGQTQRLFGRDRTDAEYKEIFKEFETDTGKGTLMVLNRAANNALLGGQWDLLGNLIGGSYKRYQQTGSFDPISMPLAQAIDNVKNTVAAAGETGFSETTIREGSRIASAIGKGRQLVGEITGDQPQRYDSARRKLKRFVDDRFLKESEYGKSKGRDIERQKLKGRFSPTLAAAQKSGIIMAIQSGDVKEANRLADEFVKSEVSQRAYFNKDNEKLIREALGFTIERAQPLKVGTSTSKEAVNALKNFMEAKDYGDMDEILALQDQYINTATKAGFIKPEKGKGSGQLAHEKSRRGKYGSDRADALARRFVLDNEMLMDKEVGGVNAAVAKAAREFEVLRASGKVTPRENAERKLFYENVIKEVKRFASAKDKEEKILEYLLPKDFNNIQNSWAKAEFLDEHFDLMGKPSDIGTRQKLIEDMINARVISKPDGYVYFLYKKSE